jgi:hypothetical protein
MQKCCRITVTEFSMISVTGHAGTLFVQASLFCIAHFLSDCACALTLQSKIFGPLNLAYVFTLLFMYSLRPILLFSKTDVSITKICLDTSILAKSIMGRREYFILMKRCFNSWHGILTWANYLYMFCSITICLFCWFWTLGSEFNPLRHACQISND